VSQGVRQMAQAGMSERLYQAETICQAWGNRRQFIRRLDSPAQAPYNRIHLE